MTEAITDFLLEHSPSWSGPTYPALADNWPTVSFSIEVLLVLFILGCLAATTTLLEKP